MKEGDRKPLPIRGPVSARAPLSPKAQRALDTIEAAIRTNEAARQTTGTHHHRKKPARAATLQLVTKHRSGSR
jgi:hypothetical protein